MTKENKSLQDDSTSNLDQNLNISQEGILLQKIKRKSDLSLNQLIKQSKEPISPSVNIFPKQVWPYQHGDEVGTAKHINPTQHNGSKLKEWDPDLLKLENNARAKNIPVEDIIAMTCDWYYMKIRGVYEGNEDMSIFNAIEIADGIAACNYESSFPALILDACEAPKDA